METVPSFLYTIEQKRAQKAYELAEDTKEYKSAAEKFPTMIVNCGLLQALSFYKSKDYLRPVLYHLQEWFCDRYKWERNIDLLDKIMRLEVPEYREKTHEALAFLTWLKRFANIKYQETEQASKEAKNAGGEDAP